MSSLGAFDGYTNKLLFNLTGEHGIAGRMLAENANMIGERH